jgi:hypothetical protein
VKRYLLSIYQPDGPPPSAELLGPVMQRVHAWNQQLRETGSWVFSAGLCPPDTATFVRVRDGRALMTDGPFVEGKEHIGGFTVIDAPDLDAALEWARKLSEAVVLDGATAGLAIEVRPFQHG